MCNKRSIMESGSAEHRRKLQRRSDSDSSCTIEQQVGEAAAVLEHTQDLSQLNKTTTETNYPTQNPTSSSTCTTNMYLKSQSALDLRTLDKMSTTSSNVSSHQPSCTSPCPSSQSEDSRSAENSSKSEKLPNANWLDPRTAGKLVTDMSPDSYIEYLFESILGFAPTPQPTLKLSSKTIIHDDGEQQHSILFIPPITEDELSNYGVDVVTACRDENLEELRSLHEGGRSLSCCNRYGESLMHMACRRGFQSIVTFLTESAGCAIRITDDCGRTPLHDALWNRDCQYGIVDMLVRSDPSLLLLCDKHGHTPFAYSRREHWGVWKQFLWDRREHIQHAMDAHTMELFRLKI